MRIKICGITSEADVAMCAEEGVDALGFVVEYPQPTPWTLGRARAAELMREVPPFVSHVAVVGGDATTILDICTAIRPHMVQLHGDEPEDVVAAVAAGLAGTGTRIIKALRVPADQPAEGGGTGSLAVLARRFLDAGADAILLDTKAGDRPAGTGRSFAWGIAREVAATVGPLILAGGLTPKNVGRAIAEARPYAVDVISAVESREHRKLRQRVRAFVAAARDAAP